MTTAAWDGKTLAADRRVSCGGSKYRLTTKIHKIKGGHVACAGALTDISTFLSWYRAGRKKKAPNLDNFEAIMVLGKRVSTWEGSVEIEMEPDSKVAVGSGWRWAAAAMDFGRTAVKAVEYACSRDNYTGGGVDSVTIEHRKK